MRKVLFNALAASGEGAGISRYCFELARHLMRMSGNVHLAVSGEYRDLFSEGNVYFFGKKVDSAAKRIFYGQGVLPWYFKGFSLIHYPDLDAPLLSAKPVVVTLHDLAHLRYPEMFTLSQRVWRKYMGLLSLTRKARLVICVSECVKQDAVELLKIPAQRIRVIYSGAGPLMPAESEDEKDSPAGYAPYILFVGTLQPRKNLVRLIRAFAIVKKQGFAHKLVIAGRKGDIYADIFAEAEKLNREDVIFRGHVPNRALAGLYKNSSAFVFPSLYEGFGFPPLEAMACGVPAVVSRTSALPEICGNAAYYVDPYSVEDIARGITRVLSDNNLRGELMAKGRARVKLFSWEQTARQTLGVYEEICGG